MKRAWIVLPDLLSIRVFVDTGIVRGLDERLEGKLSAIFLVPHVAAADWAGRLSGIDVAYGEDLTARDGLPDRALGRVDAWLDGALGSALHAAVAAGAYPDVPTAAKAMGRRQEAAFTPIAENVAAYDRLYAVYRELHDHFGRGATGAMRTLKAIRREAHA